MMEAGKGRNRRNRERVLYFKKAKVSKTGRNDEQVSREGPAESQSPSPKKAGLNWRDRGR